MNEQQQTATGEKLAKLLQLKKKANRRYNLEGGDKTALGLYRTIARVIEEADTEAKLD